MKPRWILISIFMFLLPVATITGAKPPVTLQFHPEEGQTYLVTHTYTSNSDPKNSFQMTTSSEQQITYRVEAIDPAGIYTLKATFSLYKQHVDSPYSKVDYDSSNPPQMIPPEVIQSIAPLIGESIILKVDRSGKTLETQGVKELIDRVCAKLTAQGTETKFLNQFKRWMRQYPPGEFLPQNIYPNHPVNPGDTWTIKYNDTFGNPLIEEYFQNIEVNYQLTKRQSGKSFVKVSGASNAESDQSKQTYTYSGTIQIDEKTGLIVASSLTTNYYYFLSNYNNEYRYTGISTTKTIKLK